MHVRTCILLKHVGINYLLSLPASLSPICWHVLSCNYTQPNKEHMPLWRHTHTQSHTDASESVGANFHKVNLSCENVTLDCAVPSLYI